jgi:hypothetical protein
MRVSLIIPRLLAECPIFDGRVAGAATYARVVQETSFPVPHAFVLPMSESATGDVMLSDLDQELRTRIAIVVAVPNADDRGQQSIDLLYDVRAQLLKALVGWQPTLEFGPILYLGMPDEPGITRARAWMQFDFEANDYTATAS